jgi:hypothetical protein
MSRLLVWGTGEQARRWSRLLGVRHGHERRTQTSACEALVVVNDRSSRAVADLQRALRLRRERPGLPVAVLTLVEPGEPSPQALAQALALRDEQGVAHISEDQAVALLRSSSPAIKLQISEQATSFEYQGGDPDLP